MVDSGDDWEDGASKWVHMADSGYGKCVCREDARQSSSNKTGAANELVQNEATIITVDDEFIELVQDLYGQECWYTPGALEVKATHDE